MKIKYAANCTMAVRQYVPCAIVRSGEDVLIDRNHPHAAELVALARDLVDNVVTRDADDSKGDKLLDRVEELAGADAMSALLFAWSDYRTNLRRAEAERKARAWFAAWSDIDPEILPDTDYDFLRALYDVAIGSMGSYSPYNKGHCAVFNYGYQQGYMDAMKEKAVTE